MVRTIESKGKLKRSFWHENLIETREKGREFKMLMQRETQDPTINLSLSVRVGKHAQLSNERKLMK